MSKEVWILAERTVRGLHPATLELLTEGRNLAERSRASLCACILGEPDPQIQRALAEHGADKCYVASAAAIDSGAVDALGAVLARLLDERQPTVLLIAHTPYGAELAPRLAGRCRLPCITRAKKIAVMRGRLQVTKAVLNERAYATYEAAVDRTLVVTLPVGETDVVKAETPKEPEYIRIVEEPPVRARERRRRLIPGDPRTIGIEEAEKIIAIGRGLAPQDMSAVQSLANLFGATVGGSRAAVDAGLIPYSGQIGITGKTVAPRLLLTCGISGATQFTAGMEKAEFVIAVNTDATARIFEFANIKVRCDGRAFLDALARQLADSQRRPMEMRS